MDDISEDRNQIAKTVHIIPLGFEVERVLAPFSNRHPDKVILVINNKEPVRKENEEEKESLLEKQKRYTDKVKTKLKARGVEVVPEYVNSFDLGELIHKLSSLIIQEKAAGNTVYINASSSGRFASIAAAFAGMAHNVKVYYVVADGYSNSEADIEKFGVSRCTCEHPVVEIIPNFQLNLPNDVERLILELLYVTKINNPLKEEKHWVLLKDIGKFLHIADSEKFPWDPVENPKKKHNNNNKAKESKSPGYVEYRDMQSNFSNKFQVIARSLQERNYLERKEHEKKNVSYRITQSGEYALYLSGLSGLITYDGKGVHYLPSEGEGAEKKE
ncbi:MAG TPA: DUF6293 family protein [Methanocorpusculum sp.]|nr:DUF6293 family protein [Methanocorpusculum sp.]